MNCLIDHCERYMEGCVSALAGGAQLVGVSSHAPQGYQFHSQSGHIARLQVGCLVRAGRRGNLSVFLSH